MERRNGRNHGEVFTEKKVVNYLLNEVGYVSKKDLSRIRILEPSAGTGAFAFEIINRLFESSVKYGFSFSNAFKDNVRLVELNDESFLKLKKFLIIRLKELNCKDFACVKEACLNTDFLTYDFKIRFDCIVGNPPYIRHELIAENKKREYKKTFQTFKYRADLYVLFFERSLKLLSTMGKLSFICSNRWLNNQYGEPLRKAISTEYNLVKVLNIEQSSPFDEEVIAYPCVTTIENAEKKPTILFCEDNSKKIDFQKLIFVETKNPNDASWENLFLSYDINHSALEGIVEQGFEIGIGVATGIDSVFIKNKTELNGIEKSRLLPIITSKDLRGNKILWGQRYLINPYKGNDLCNLDDYPFLKAYLVKNKSLLVKRHTAKKTPEKWYKTIDKIKPELQKKPKILLPDLTGNKVLLIDEGNYYPHHNIYYITGKDIQDLKILASILMSSFVMDQLSKIGIRMNGGLPRFQAQVLKKIKIPSISLFEQKLKDDLLQAYEDRNVYRINDLIEGFCKQNNLLPELDLLQIDSKSPKALSNKRTEQLRLLMERTAPYKKLTR